MPFRINTVTKNAAHKQIKSRSIKSIWCPQLVFRILYMFPPGRVSSASFFLWCFYYTPHLPHLPTVIYDGNMHNSANSTFLCTLLQGFRHFFSNQKSSQMIKIAAQPSRFPLFFCRLLRVCPKQTCCFLPCSCYCSSHFHLVFRYPLMHLISFSL